MCTDFSDAQDRIGGCVARCGIFPFLSNFQVYDKKFTHIAKLKKGIDDRMNYIFIIGELQMICSSVTAHGLRYLCSYFYIKTKTAISFVFFFSGGVLSQSYHSATCVCMCVCLCARCTCVLDVFFLLFHRRQFQDSSNAFRIQNVIALKHKSSINFLRSSILMWYTCTWTYKYMRINS